MRFANKRALVTGAAGALGAAIAKAFAMEGARVVVADVDAQAVAELADTIVVAGGDACAVALDVTKPEDWERVVREARHRWGGVDVLINNAAVASGLTRIEERMPEDWDRSMAVNAKGPFLGTRALLPVFRAQGGGTIVNVSSVAGIGQSQIMDAAYACSKAALTMLTRVTAAQHSGEGIRCNSVHPGPIDSALARAAYIDPAALSARLSRVPVGRLATADEVVAAVLFLAGEDASYITGAALAVDGGALVQ
ncbi:glucose 1-dehydrogenase [Sphingomonas sp. H39-1-10]|uniref:SDR family NAD(P)-dependent oxidoreductase n=1 Tax=Sphingomonas pollutisoli TaxID=3030829 RepID=UPI0023B99715|nr:glucose 1-dehydrogenase [Sphingomonas pollutisoli]MDF0487494.1 glucose 1-dehydrogenase [Sphingomonas pollutisoli]